MLRPLDGRDIADTLGEAEQGPAFPRAVVRVAYKDRSELTPDGRPIFRPHISAACAGRACGRISNAIGAAPHY